LIVSHLIEELFEDTKGVIRICMHNDQEKKHEKTNNDLQNITHKTKDRVIRTPLKTGGELNFSFSLYTILKFVGFFCFVLFFIEKLYQDVPIILKPDDKL
jgi:hypothetical protein